MLAWTFRSRVSVVGLVLLIGLLCQSAQALDDDEDDIDLLGGDDVLKKRGGTRSAKPSEGDPDEEGSEFDEDPEFNMEPDEPGLDDAIDDPGGLPPEPELGFPDDDDPVESFDRGRRPPPAASPPPEAKPPPPKVKKTGIGLEIDGKLPLEDNYPVQVVARDLDAVVVELPVLVSRSRSDFAGPDFWLVADIEIDGRKVAETRQLVTGAALADLGPTFAWIKSFAPVGKAQGTIVVKVGRQEVGGADAEPLFQARTDYKL